MKELGKGTFWSCNLGCYVKDPTKLVAIKSNHTRNIDEYKLEDIFKRLNN